jgi:TonB family protein
MTRRIVSWLTVALLVWLIPTILLGWGRDGHAIIAAVAEAHLTEGARLGIIALLNDQSLASIASWADEVRPQRDETYNWHFVDIPTSAAFDEQRDCYRPNDSHAGAQTDHHNCVVDRIGMFKQILMNPSASDTDRVEALKFIVHFVADVHQPFHAIGDAKGGNGIRISEFGSSQCGERPCNLHAAWDTGLIAHTNPSQQEYVQHLEKLISQQHLTAGGQPEDWANDSHKYAEAAWLNDGEQVDENYYKSQIKVVDTRLALAGLRLAALLNDAFGQQTAPAPPKKDPFVLSHGSAIQPPSASGDAFGPGTGEHGRQMGGLEILSDTQGVDFGPYVARILQDVKENWYRLIPKSAKMKNGKVAIEFAITKDGKVAGTKLTDASGDVALDRAAWGGITASNPFPPLPSEFGGHYLALRFRFYYNPTPGTLSQGSPEVSQPTSTQSNHAQAVPSPDASTTVASAAFAASRDAIGEARALFRKGHFDAALQKYQELLQGQPKLPDAMPA